MEDRNEHNSDKILIKDLLLRCIVGINESERREKQDVLINVVIWVDLTQATETDDMSRTVDYKRITKDIVNVVEKSEFFLVETLAESVAKVCLQHERVEKVRVTVEKPGALRFARSVGVEILREKG